MGCALSSCSKQLAHSTKLSQGALSPPNACGPPVGADMMGSVHSLTRLLLCAAHLPPSPPPQTQPGLCSKAGTQPLQLCYMNFVLFGDWNTLNTLLLEHCLSLEKAPLLSSPLSPTAPWVPAGRRQTCYGHYAEGT